MKFGVRKLESWGFLTQYRRVTDRQADKQTDGQTDRHVAITITRASIASRG